MKSLTDQVTEVITTRRKPEMVRWIRRHPDSFPVLIALTFSSDRHLAWRAAWVLWDAMEPNDQRLTPVLKKVAGLLLSFPDNLLREWLMVFQRLDLPERLEGQVFDSCLTVWEDIDKQPSVRLNALKLILQMTVRYPELATELTPVFEDRYLETLTPVARRSFNLMHHQFNRARTAGKRPANVGKITNLQKLS